MTSVPLAPGSRVGDYEVVRELSRGAVGETFAARAVSGPREGELVCLKVLAREFRGIRSAEREAAIKHLRHEARVVSQLDHPNIARLLDSGVAGDVWFLAFELVEGADLSAFGADALEPDHVAHLALELSKALACAHERDVLHRDIKPSNILISTSGEAKLVDFGLAKLNAGAASQFSQHVGTPRYFSPEQLRGEALTAATDIYSLGLVLFELLAGCHPFYDPDVDLFRRNVLQGLLQASLQGNDVPEDLLLIVERCIQLDSTKRFANGAELQHALSAVHQSASASDDTLSELGVLKVAAAGSAMLSPTRLGRLADRLADIRDEPGDLPTRISADPTAVFREVTRIAPAAAEAHRQAMQADHVVGDLSRIARTVAEQRSSGLAPTVQQQRSGVRPVGEAARLEQRPPTHATSLASSAPAESQNAAQASQREAQRPPTAIRSSRRWTRSSGIAALCLLFIALVAGVVLLRPSHEATTSPAPTPATSNAAARALERPAAAIVTRSQEAKAANAAERAGDAPSPPDVTATPPSNAAANAERARRSRVAARDLVSVTIGTIPYGEVIVDGKRVGTAPLVIKLPRGPHRIVGRSQQLRRVETIVVSPEMNHVVLDLRK